MSNQVVYSTTSIALTERVCLFRTWVCLVAAGSWASLVAALENLGVGVTKLDGNISLQLVLESDSLHTRQGLDHCTLSVGDVTDRSNVDSSLTGNKLWGEGGQVVWTHLLKPLCGLDIGGVDRLGRWLLDRGLELMLVARDI